MFDVKTETFLFDYFLYDEIIGNYTDREKTFRCLGEIWNIEQDKLRDLYLNTEKENVRSVSSENEYMRYRRIKQYNKLVGNPDVCNEMEDALIAVKGEAIRVIAKYEMESTVETTKNAMHKALLINAQSGNIVALRIIGILECEGLLGEVDLEAGLEHLGNAMRWCDITSTLAYIKYDEKNRASAINMLKSSVKDTLCKFLLKETEEKYGIVADGYNEELLLLKQAFNLKKTASDVYNSMYARLVFSPIITLRDKEKIVYSERKDLLTEACDLPLHLYRGDIPVNESALDEMIFKREKELVRIKNALSNRDLRCSSAYLPICITCESEFVLDQYAYALRKVFKDANVETFEVRDLNDYSFEPNKDNAFIVGLSESKPNVILFFYKGDVSDRTIKITKDILRTERRRKTRLFNPSITMDLTPVLPICFSDKENVKKLQEFVDIIAVEPLSKEEKEESIKFLMNKNSNKYKMKEVTIDDLAMEKLKDVSIDDAKKVLGRIYRENLAEDKTLNITLAMVQASINKLVGKSNYGFGGTLNVSE